MPKVVLNRRYLANHAFFWRKKRQLFHYVLFCLISEKTSFRVFGGQRVQQDKVIFWVFDECLFFFLRNRSLKYNLRKSLFLIFAFKSASKSYFLGLQWNFVCWAIVRSNIFCHNQTVDVVLSFWHPTCITTPRFFLNIRCLFAEESFERACFCKLNEKSLFRAFGLQSG